MDARMYGAREISRRDALTWAGAAAIGVAGAGLLASCTGRGGRTGPVGSGVAGTPVRGGRFIVGAIGGPVTGTINPLTYNDVPGSIRAATLYNRLFRLDEDLKQLVPQLAVSAEPNATATVWTLQLRDGVTFHDGKPFGADDVVHTFGVWADPTVFVASAITPLVDLKGVRKLGPLTVEIPLIAPIAAFDTLLTGPSVVQAGSTLASLSQKAIGTGPFTLVSSAPGQTVLAANKNYWEHGKPYVDDLVINSSFSDETARLNALLSGQINIIGGIAASAAKQQESSGQVTILRAHSNAPLYFSMRTDKAPFNDVRVRQALRLVADRQELINDALSGYGTVGNDLLGTGTQYFAANLTRSRDVDQAKALLKAAGQEGLSVTLRIAAAFPGATESATLFQQQAKAAGININLETGTPASYFQPASGWPYSFGEDGWGISFPSLTAAYNGVAGLNESGWNPAQDPTLSAASAALDKSKAAQLWATVQREQFDTGGYLIWAQPDFLDAVAKKVHGLQTTAAGNLNSYRLQDGWLAR